MNNNKLNTGIVALDEELEKGVSLEKFSSFFLTKSISLRLINDRADTVDMILNLHRNKESKKIEIECIKKRNDNFMSEPLSPDIEVKG